MSRPSLSLLPNELLSNICAFLCPHCSSFLDPFQILDLGITQGQKDLLSVWKTSERLRRVASPFLYHMLSPTGGSYLRRHLDIIRKMHERPDLAAQVRHADFRAYPWPGGDHLEADIEFDIEDLIARLALRDVLPVGWARRPIEIDSWIDGWDEQQHLRQVFAVELPVSLAPNLECLHVELPHYGWDPGRSRLSSSELLLLERLYLSVRCIDEYSDYPTLDLDQVGGLMDRAPNLRLLSMQMCGRVPPGLSLGSVAVLNLYKPRLKEEDAVNLLAALTNLQALCYILDVEDGSTDLTPRKLVKAMQPAGRTLRYLELRWDGELLVELDDVVTSLEAFSVLETLIIDSCCFYSDEPDAEAIAAQDESKLAGILPPSLRSVSLGAFTTDVLPDVLRFIAVPQLCSFANLREFSVDSWRLQYDVTDDLIVAFSDTRVCFRVLGNPEPAYAFDTEALLRGDFRPRLAPDYRPLEPPKP